MKRYAVVLILLLSCFGTAMAQAPARPATSAKISGKPLPLTALLGAFEPEVSILKTKLIQKKIITIQGIEFTKGILNGRPVVIAQTGIGKVNAAVTTTLVLDHFRPEQVIFTGIAGGINPELSPGDIVIGTSVAHHDYGAITPDSMQIRPTKDPSSMQENPVYFESDAALVSLADKLSATLKLDEIIRHNNHLKPKIIKGRIITGDVFVSSATATQVLRKRTGADATEMEGASVAQVCWQQKVPFIIIRSLSDNAGDNAADDVKKFYEIAAKNSASLVMAMLEKLGGKPVAK